VVRTAPGGGFKCKYEQAGEDWQPRAQQECGWARSLMDGGMKSERGRGHGFQLLNVSSQACGTWTRTEHTSGQIGAISDEEDQILRDRGRD
jgi:hypothetical protein